MPNTSAWNLPYPTGTQVPNVPADIQALAVAVDSKLTSITAFTGGEWKATALQNLVAGGNKLTFGSTVIAASGITWNGTDTITVVTAGVYTMFANARVANATISSAIHFSGSTYSDATLLFPGTSTSNGYGDYSHSATGYLAAGTVINVWMYTGGSNNTVFATRPPMFKMWRVG